MEIIKDAFVEGRTTDIEWKKSNAQKNQLKLDVAVENLSMMKRRDFHTPMPLHQVCPATGKVLNTFPSRLAAARYIVKNVLNRPDKDPFAVTGNMDMCMRAGWKAYGFYWKLANSTSIETHVKSPIHNANRVYMTKGVSGGVFESIKAAAETFGVSSDSIARRLSPNSPRLGKYIIQAYNPTLQTLTFNNLKEAAAYANVGINSMSRWIKNKKSVNNTKYIALNSTMKATLKYIVYNGRKIAGKFATAKDVATYVGSTRSRVVKSLKNNTKLGEYHQYRVKRKYL